MVSEWDNCALVFLGDFVDRGEEIGGILLNWRGRTGRPGRRNRAAGPGSRNVTAAGPAWCLASSRSHPDTRPRSPRAAPPSPVRRTLTLRSLEGCRPGPTPGYQRDAEGELAHSALSSSPGLSGQSRWRRRIVTTASAGWPMRALYLGQTAILIAQVLPIARHSGRSVQRRTLVVDRLLVRDRRLGEAAAASAATRRGPAGRRPAATGTRGYQAGHGRVAAGCRGPARDPRRRLAGCPASFRTGARLP